MSSTRALASRVGALVLVMALAASVIATRKIVLGLDFQGGAVFTYELSSGRPLGDDELMNARKVIDRRIDALDLRDASVLVQGSEITVQIADTDPAHLEELRSKMLTRGSVLELVAVDDDWHPPSDAIGPGIRVESAALENGSERFLVADGPDAKEKLSTALRALTPPPGERLAVGEAERGAFRSYALVNEGGVPGPRIREASVAVDSTPSMQGAPPSYGVDVEYDPEGSALLEALTTRQAHKRIAIVLDGEVRSAPRVLDPIRGGKAHITMGRDSGISKAANLADALRAGSLPGELSLVSQNVIRPAMDASTLRARSGIAALVWLAIAAASALRYRVAGGAWSLLGPAACASVGFALVAYLEGTLTLPFVEGIAIAAVATWAAGALRFELARRGRSGPIVWPLLLALPLALAVIGLVLYETQHGPVRGLATGLGFGFPGALIGCVLAVPPLAKFVKTSDS